MCVDASSRRLIKGSALRKRGIAGAVGREEVLLSWHKRKKKDARQQSSPAAR
jgi:hypothetical protein